LKAEYAFPVALHVDDGSCDAAQADAIAQAVIGTKTSRLFIVLFGRAIGTLRLGPIGLFSQFYRGLLAAGTQLPTYAKPRRRGLR
jgi:hypothetical protein